MIPPFYTVEVSPGESGRYHHLRRRIIMTATLNLTELGTQFETHSPAQILAWTLSTFDPEKVAFACSLGAEDVVLVDLLSKHSHLPHIFYLETGYHFPETLAVKKALKQRYGVDLIPVYPETTVPEQDVQHGKDLFSRDPKECCQIRKVQPLKRYLKHYDAWITGIRRDQAPARANAKKIEDDTLFGLVKLNPIADWTSEQVWEYIRANKVPYNELHDKHYPSIGCAPCTKQVMPGQDPRAGRWAGFEKTECGLHKEGE